MFLQFWLLAILVPLALGAPVPRASGPPTLTLVDSISDAKSISNLPKSEVNRANKVGWHLEGNSIVIGSKATSDKQGSPLGPKKMGLNRANKPSWYLKSGKARTGSKTTEKEKGSSSLSGYLALSTGVSSSGSGISGGTSSQGSGSNTGTGGTTTGSEGTTTGTGTTTGSESTTSGTTTSSDGTSTTTVPKRK